MLSYIESGNQFQISFPGQSDVFISANQASLDSLGVPIKLEKFTSGEIYKPVTIPGTYRQSESNPQGIVDILFAPIKGLYDTVDILFFVFMIGGFIKVFNDSGVLEKGISVLTQMFKGREKWLIVILTLLTAAGGTTFGLAEETITFYPILVPVLLAAGYDVIVPLAVIFVGAHIGNMGATVNPFSVIIASNSAGVLWTEGIMIRLISLGVFSVISIAYIMRYGERVRKNPALSLVARFEKDHKLPFDIKTNSHARMDLRSGILLTVFAATFILMVVGVTVLDWWLMEMSALFLGAAILSAILLRLPEKKFVSSFVEGAADLVGVSLVIGFARGVTVILQDGNVIDTILFYATSVVSGIPQGFIIVGLLFLFIVMAFFISSTSGLAVVTMPIMGALAINVGIPADAVVNSYLFGMGIMYLISPTELILPSIAMVNINYNTWIKFILPLMGLLTLASMLILLFDIYLG